MRHALRSYARYYNGVRTHLSLGKDLPHPRPETSRRSGAFSRCRSSKDCTTITSEFN